VNTNAWVERGRFLTAGGTTIQIAAASSDALWRRLAARLRGHGPAFLAALALNAGFVTAMALFARTDSARPERVVEAVLVRPEAVRSEPRAAVRQAGDRRRRRSVAPASAPSVVLPYSPPQAAPGSASGSAAVDLRWKVDTSPWSRRAFVPSPLTSLEKKARCAEGEFDRLPTEERDACLKTWGEPPKGPSGWGGPPARDPGGGFGRAAAKAEDKRRPMTKPPIGPCAIDRPGSNLGFGCS
jgi:hypothetical protein